MLYLVNTITTEKKSMNALLHKNWYNLLLAKF